MISIDIDAKGALLTDRWHPIYVREMRLEMKRAVELGTREVASKTPVGVTAILRTGIFGKVIAHNHGRVSVRGPASKYADIVEKGRRPSDKFPPFDAIRTWLRLTDKGRAFVAAIKRTYGIRNNDSALKQATFLKARAIKRRGYRGKFMFEESVDILEPRILSMFRSRLNRIARILTRD